MARYVYTCNSKQLLNDWKSYDTVKVIPHITATKELADRIKNSFPDVKFSEGIGDIIDEIVPMWNSMETGFQQFINLSKVIREYLPDEECALKQSFKKNKRDLLNAIRVLVEADINPEDIMPTSEEEKMFSEIWWELEELDAGIYEFRKTMRNFMKDKSTAGTVLSEIGIASNSKYIILHGFYFITPIQERLFKLLESVGFGLVFLADCGNENYGVNEIWEQTFSDKGIYKWENAGIESTYEPLSGFYSKLNDSGEILHNDIKIIKYHTEMDFVADFQRLKAEGFHVYSTDTETVELLLKEFYPEAFQKRNLLAYPIGQYIYQLHGMWNDNEERIEIEMESLYACFSSGWLTYEGKNANAFISDLAKLAPYIEDCITIDEWEKRIELIREIRHKVFPLLEKHIAKKEGDSVYFHELMANPLRNFSCFTIPENRLEVIFAFINKLISDIKILFNDGKDNTTNIRNHLKKLQVMICDGREELVHEEERIIADELISRFKFGRMEIDECNIADMAEAIMLIAGSGIINEDEQCIDSVFNKRLVKPFVQVDITSSISPEKVHVCLADETRLPNVTSNYIWPISNNLLDNLNCTDYQKRYVDIFKSIHVNRVIASRYLMNCALRNSYVEFSWIEEDDGKKIEKSPYLQLLEMGYGIETEVYQKEIPVQDGYIRFSEQKEIQNRHPEFEEACIDKLLCPWRYIYGYILDEYPSYSNAFHYNFGISALIKSITSVAPISKDDAFRMVMELFPYLREVEKQQIYDYSNMKKNMETTYFDDVIYPKARLNVHFLKENIASYGLKLLRIDDEELAATERIPKQELCRYCPHIDYCTKADRGGNHEKP